MKSLFLDANSVVLDIQWQSKQPLIRTCRMRLVIDKHCRIVDADFHNKFPYVAVCIEENVNAWVGPGAYYG